MNRPLRVFLCHSSNDKPAVRELYQKLRAEPWIQPWLDEEELYPGQDWNMEIEKAVEVADAIIVCLSKGSITKEGYVQRELRTVLDFADYKPEGTLYIIPVRLEDCEPPRRLRAWQYADYFEGQRERALERLIVSLKRRADSLGLKVEQPADKEKKLTPKEDEQVPDWFIDVANEVLQLDIPTPNKITLLNGMEFMRVPAGKFEKGESKKHNVNISYAYWMGRYPVTNGMYDMVIKRQYSYGWDKKREHPVVFVTWIDANNYCQELNRLFEDNLPSGLVFRLPTENEWLMAALSTDGRKYPWGNSFDKKRCNSTEGGIGDTTPVGLFSPQGDSPYDCGDMAGNVYEWTSNSRLPSSLELSHRKFVKNTDNIMPFSLYGICGSSWRSNVSDLYSLNLNYNYFDTSLDDLGFRVCIAPPLHK